MKKNITARIYVACLAAYNNGRLHGKWIELDGTTTEEEIQEQVSAMLAASPIPQAEEWAIHDHEGLGKISESQDFASIVERLELMEEHGQELTLAALDYYTDLEDAKSALEDDCLGIHDSKEDFAEEWHTEAGHLENVPDCLKLHIDWSSVVRDLECEGWIFISLDGGKVAVFSC